MSNYQGFKLEGKIFLIPSPVNFSKVEIFNKYLEASKELDKNLALKEARATIQQVTKLIRFDKYPACRIQRKDNTKKRRPFGPIDYEETLASSLH